MIMTESFIVFPFKCNTNSLKSQSVENIPNEITEIEENSNGCPHNTTSNFYIFAKEYHHHSRRMFRIIFFFSRLVGENKVLKKKIPILARIISINCFGMYMYSTSQDFFLLLYIYIKSNKNIKLNLRHFVTI